MLDLETLKSNPLSLVITSALISSLLTYFVLKLIWSRGALSVTSNVVSTDFEQVEESSASITVDVSGAVEKPGVYTFTNKARLGDAVSKAGGFDSNAAGRWISQKLNMAEILKDSEKVYIPFEWDYVDQTNSLKLETLIMESSSAPISDGGVLVKINSASLDQLVELPAIGEVTANKIISNRPYANEEEFLTKTKITQGIYAKFKDLITFD